MDLQKQNESPKEGREKVQSCGEKDMTFLANLRNKEKVCGEEKFYRWEILIGCEFGIIGLSRFRFGLEGIVLSARFANLRLTVFK